MGKPGQFQIRLDNQDLAELKNFAEKSKMSAGGVGGAVIRWWLKLPPSHRGMVLAGETPPRQYPPALMGLLAYLDTLSGKDQREHVAVMLEAFENYRKGLT